MVQKTRDLSAVNESVSKEVGGPCNKYGLPSITSRIVKKEPRRWYFEIAVIRVSDLAISHTRLVLWNWGIPRATDLLSSCGPSFEFQHNQSPWLVEPDIYHFRDVVPAKPKVLTDAVDALSKSGFLNYFGMQRFGTTAVGTHMIGLSLLRGDWDLAIDLIMRKKSGETQDAEHARSVWQQTKDAKATLELMPKRCVAERCS